LQKSPIKETIFCNVTNLGATDLARGQLVYGVATMSRLLKYISLVCRI